MTEYRDILRGGEASANALVTYNAGTFSRDAADRWSAAACHILFVTLFVHVTECRDALWSTKMHLLIPCHAGIGEIFVGCWWLVECPSLSH